MVDADGISMMGNGVFGASNICFIIQHQTAALAGSVDSFSGNVRVIVQPSATLEKSYFMMKTPCRRTYLKPILCLAGIACMYTTCFLASKWIKHDPVHETHWRKAKIHFEQPVSHFVNAFLGLNKTADTFEEKLKELGQVVHRRLHTLQN